MMCSLNAQKRVAWYCPNHPKLRTRGMYRYALKWSVNSVGQDTYDSVDLRERAVEEVHTARCLWNGHRQTSMYV